MNALKAAILAHEQDFVSALNADFAHRSREETLMFDVGSTLGTINYLLRHLSRWMRPEPCDVALIFQPSTNRVVYQPLGVVGVVSPWNYPVGLALIPLATALAASNRVMLKPSELVPATSELLVSVLAEALQEDQVAVVTGDAKVGSAFSSLPFDHILFTGSIPVGRAIEIGSREAGASPQSRLFLLVLLSGVTDAMDVMKDEIFGPILPIVPYRTLEEAVAYVGKVFDWLIRFTLR